jgi:type IX secretion system PorP/SprF family membrane protein
MMSDNAGDGIYKQTFVSASYSYRVDINREIKAKIGVEAGFIQTKLDWDKLVFYDQLDPITGPYSSGGTRNLSSEKRPLELQRTNFDISSGLLLYGSDFYFGVAVKHMASPNQGYLNINPDLRLGLRSRWVINGGYEIMIDKGNRNRMNSFLSPNILYTKQGDNAQLNIGTYAALGPMICGLWYRTTFTNADAAMLLLGFRFEGFKIGYSYDFTVSGLSGKTGGAHEIGLTWNLDPDAGKHLDFNDCFKMFR